MKHRARNKKNARRSSSRICLNASSHPNLAPHSMQAPFLRKSGQPLNQTPKPPTQRNREKKAGASALFKTISTLQPLSKFFFPIILTFEYIL